MAFRSMASAPLRRFAGTPIAAFALVLAATGCETAEPPPDPLPALLAIPQGYRAQAEGLVKLGADIVVPGRVRLRYSVNPDGSVVATHFNLWVDDVDLPVTFLWWEVAREQLRCTSFTNVADTSGMQQGAQITFPPGVEIHGVAFSEREAEGCVGKARDLSFKSSGNVVVEHNPADDVFALAAVFEATYEGNTFTVDVDTQGSFLNRPPIVEIAHAAPGLDGVVKGCPGVEKGKPPIALANGPEGLTVSFLSGSHDPDHNWPPEQKPKQPRVDVAFEDWSRTRSGRFRYLGSGPEIGPLLFETGLEHEVLLQVRDRTGAEARQLCHFQVQAQ